MTDKADERLDLAKQHFGKLTQAETKLFKTEANGQFADYQVGDKKKDDPAQGDQWGKTRTLRADRIEWLCTNTQASRYIGHKGIQILGAKIEGELDLLFARIAFPIVLLSCRVVAPMDFKYSKVGGLFFNGSLIAGLAADGLTTEGGINLRDGFHSNSEVRLLGGSIGGDLDCSKGRFHNLEGDALSADGLKVKGSVILGDGFHAEGEVRLLNANIGGSLNFINCRLENPNGNALSADRLKVEGNIFFRARKDKRGSEAKPIIRGDVGFIRAEVNGGLQWLDMGTPSQTSLDLRYAQIGVLLDEPASWPGAGKLFLDGFIYERIEGLQTGDAKNRIKWVQRSEPGRFTPQPYEQLAKVFKDTGLDHEARDVLIAKNKQYRRLITLSTMQKVWYHLLGPLIGFGYRPWNMFYLAAGIFTLGILIFYGGERARIFSPAQYWAYADSSSAVYSIAGADSLLAVVGDSLQPALTARGDTLDGRLLRLDYPRLKLLVYSLDAFVPLVDLHQVRYWLPNIKRIPMIDPDLHPLWRVMGIITPVYFWVHILLGWFVTTLLVVGLTGIIRT